MALFSCFSAQNWASETFHCVCQRDVYRVTASFQKTNLPKKTLSEVAPILMGKKNFFLLKVDYKFNLFHCNTVLWVLFTKWTLFKFFAFLPPGHLSSDNIRWWKRNCKVTSLSSGRKIPQDISSKATNCWINVRWTPLQVIVIFTFFCQHSFDFWYSKSRQYEVMKGKVQNHRSFISQKNSLAFWVFWSGKTAMLSTSDNFCHSVESTRVSCMCVWVGWCFFQCAYVFLS